jgi:peptidoglycan/xylan/chitin deacetylase (PgdA/CDA1 family)
MTLIVVNYHYVRPCFEHPFPGIHGITPSALEAQLQLLKQVGEFVSLSQVRDAAGNGGKLPRCAFLITLDDGLREQVEVALPVLDRLGVPAAFFVNTSAIAHHTVTPVHKSHLLRAYTPPEHLNALLHTEARRLGLDMRLGDPADATAIYPWDAPDGAQLKYFLHHRLAPEVGDALIAACFRARFGDDEASVSRELYMSVAQVRMLGARGYLGTHGDRHVPLGCISRAAVREDVRMSLDWLAEWSGVRPFALSYPFGSYEASNSGASAGVADEGVELAFTTERAANVDLDRPLHLARFDCNDLPGGKQPGYSVESLFDAAPAARWHR